MLESMFYNSEITNISAETFAQALNLVESRLQLLHCTEPANRRNAEEAMHAAYRSAGLAPPKILWCNSPLEAYLAKAILCTLNSDELSKEYMGLSISHDRIAQIRGDCVRHNIRDDLLYNLADSFYSKFSELVRSRLLAAMSQRFQLTPDEFSVYSRTIEETVNRIAYIENARDWNLWEWHGIRVNEQIIMRPDEITVADIEHESNAEVRSVLLERFGEERYFTAGAMEAVDDDPKYGTLLKRKGPVQMMMVRVVNSTCEPDGSTKTYLLRVPEWMHSTRSCSLDIRNE